MILAGRPGRESPLIDIGQTLSQSEILLTGSNGFLGKVLLGLLLDRYPEIKHLHVLVRPRRSQSARDRFFNEVLRSPALEPIVRKRSENLLRDKITVWEGDIAKPICGLCPADLETLTGRVSLIINCAGRVDFFPPVDESFGSNVDGVEYLVAVSKMLRAKLAHISTCYVCGEADGLIEESEPIVGFYPRRKGPEDRSFDCGEELRYCRERIRQIYESGRTNGQSPGEAGAGWRVAAAPGNSREIAQRLTALGKQRAEYWGWVNTYTYSKSLGEQILAVQKDLDYVIIRPAIIESALRYPFPGWIEGGRTAAPLVLMALGGLKDWPVRRDVPLEVIPVDLVASAVLVASALLLKGEHRPIYQLGTADANPIWLEKLVTLLDAESRKRRKQNGDRIAGAPLIDRFVAARSPWGREGVRFVSTEEARIRRKKMQKRISQTETLIARMGKMLEAARLPGKQSLSSWSTALRTLSLQAAFREQTIEQFLPFILHNRYIFESENIRAAYAAISEKDRELLPWDPERIDWKNYWIDNQVKGIEKWVQPDAVKEWTFRI